MLEFDRSTINAKALEALPLARIAAGCRTDSHYGMGCAGDPPGFPSYFLQSVYNAQGNDPRKGSTVVLFGRKIENAEDSWNQDKRDELLRSLYLPLPLDSERVQLWIAATFQHLHNCYQHPTEKEYGRPKVIIYPLPFYEKEPLKEFRDDFRFSDEWRIAEKVAIAEANVSIRKINDERKAERAKVCTVDNHCAVVTIRRYYPSFVPTEKQIQDPDEQFQTEWPYRYASRPTDQNCPGWLDTAHGQQDNCRMCGRTDLGKG